MKHNKLLDFIGTLMLLTGFFLAFLPHAVHIAVGLDNETSHLKHVVYGIMLVVIALIILVYNNDAFKWSRKEIKTFILRK